MAITPPTTYDPIGFQDLVGTVTAGDGATVLDRIGENTNYMWAYHTPAMANFGVDRAPFASLDVVYAVFPSADTLDYTIDLATYCSTGVDTVTVDIEYSLVSSAGPWLTGPTLTNLHAAVDEWWTGTFSAMPDTTRYLKLACSVSGAGTMQLQSFCMRPAVQTSIPTPGPLNSLFQPYDSAHLLQADAAVHTEYFNRFANNARVVIADREQQVLSLVATNDIRQLSTGVYITADRTIAKARAYMPGQAGARLNVRLRASDTGGGNGEINIQIAGGNSVSLAADDTDQAIEGTDLVNALKIPSERPVFIVTAANIDTAVTVEYLSITWTPGR